MNRVVIVVKDGLVQGIVADDPETEAIVIDWDHIIESVETEKLRNLDLTQYFAYPVDSGTEEVERYLTEAQKELRKEFYSRFGSSKKDWRPRE